MIRVYTSSARTSYCDDTRLSSSCEYALSGFMAAVVKACNDDQAQSFKTAGEFKLGVAAKTAATDSKAATADADGVVAMYTDFGAAVVGADGKILAALTEAIQPKIAINNLGEIVDKTFVDTKRVLKSGYGMEGKVDNNGDGVMKEWFQQADAYAKYAVGKTGAELKGMETELVNNHYISKDKALLSAGCTIQITGICAVVAQSVTNAR